jgi:hypothetical protein
MYKVIKSAFVEFKQIEDEKINVIRAEIICDSESDLPDADSIDGMELSVGSIAWAIDTGAFYGLSSEGTWYNQDGSGTAGAENSLQSNTAASPDRLIKQSVDLGTIEDDIIPNDIAESEDEPILSEEEQKDEVIEEPIVEKAEKKGKIAEAKGDEDAVRNTENI